MPQTFPLSTLALARALVIKQEYLRERVATNDRAWVESCPFDMAM